MLVRLKSVMEWIKMLQFGTRKYSGKRAVNYLDSEIIVTGTQHTIMYIFYAAREYFESYGKGTFDEIVFYQLFFNF